MERSGRNMDERTASPQEVGEERDWKFPPVPNGIDDFFDVPGLSVDGRILPGWSEKVSDGPVRIRMVRFGQKLMRRFEKKKVLFKDGACFPRFCSCMAHVFPVFLHVGTHLPCEKASWCTFSSAGRLHQHQ